MAGVGGIQAAVWLLLLITIQTCSCEPRLARPGSTHPSFPLDAFAKPSYKVIFQDDRPVGNQTALELLRASSSTSDGRSLQDVQSNPTTTGAYDEADVTRKTNFKAYLHRSSQDTLHVCTLARAHPSQSRRTLELDEDALDEYRAGVLRRALTLLAPLKTGCLFYTHDWFTYSFCHGDALRQFRALPSTLGGGKTPAMDPTQDSYVLGRWRPDSESIHASSPSHRRINARTVGEAPVTLKGEPLTEVDDASVTLLGIDEEEQAGTTLMELVRFSSMEDARPEIHSHASSSGYSIEGKGRYISQRWSDGTPCNINNEARATEVQFHCAKSPPVDRIALIKEVTTCNYVVVIETPRLCEEPALAQVEDEIEEVHCRPILSEVALHQRYLDRVRDSHASLIEGAKRSEVDVLRDGSGQNHEIASAVSSGQEDASSFESQIQNIFEKLTNTKLPAGKATVEEIELVVGMDEEGNLILEPRGDRADSRTDQSKADNEVFYDARESASEDTATATNLPTLSTERLAEIVQKIKEMGLVGGEGTVIKILQGDETPPGEPSVQPNGVEQQQHSPAQAQGNMANARQNAGTSTGQAQRGNLMVRETETFAQRVDRIYRAQEAAKHNEVSSTQTESAASEGKKDSDERRREPHAEL